MNKVTLTGNLTKDAELRKTPDGKSVCDFILAVGRFKKDEADFIRCQAWEQRADLITKYCKKGSHILIEGRIRTGSYDDKDGKKVYTTDVIVEQMEFLTRKSESTQESTSASTPNFNQEIGEDANGDPYNLGGLAPDDLPF